MRGMEKPDYELIAKLEIECGIVNPVPSPVAELVNNAYDRFVNYSAVARLRLTYLEAIQDHDSEAVIITQEGPKPVSQVIASCTIQPGKQWYD